MRALFLIPGDGVDQLQSLPAVAATAEGLGFAIQVACPPEQAPIWKLLPAVEKVIPFAYGNATLADWANLLGSVREPDFQVAVNLAPGRQMDLMLSMSHIPTRIASAGFSATETVAAPAAGWPAQALAGHLRPIGVDLQAEVFRLQLKPAALAEATAALPAGDGPMLLLAPGGGPSDWPGACWQELPERIRASLPGLRSSVVAAAGAGQAGRRAATVAASDVVLSSDPLTTELALLCGTPVVALGRSPESLPERAGVQGIGAADGLSSLGVDAVLQALGLA